MALAGPPPCQRTLPCSALCSLRLQVGQRAETEAGCPQDADAPHTPRWGADHAFASDEEDIVEDFLGSLQAKLPADISIGLSSSRTPSSTLHQCREDVEVYPRRPRGQVASLGSTECSDDLAEASVSSSVGESIESWAPLGATSENKQAILRSVARHWGHGDLPNSLSRMIDMSMSSQVSTALAGKPAEKVKLPPPVPLDLHGLSVGHSLADRRTAHLQTPASTTERPLGDSPVSDSTASRGILTPVAIACPYCLRDSLQPLRCKLPADAKWKCSSCSCVDDPAAQTCSLCLRQVCVACSRAGACQEGLDLRCQAGHILWPLPARQGPDCRWTCSVCLQDGSELPGAVRHRCPSCEVDLCELCFGRRTHKRANSRRAGEKLTAVTSSVQDAGSTENAEAFAILHNQVGVKLMEQVHDMETVYSYLDALHAVHMRCFGVPSSAVLYNKTCCLCSSLRLGCAGHSPHDLESSASCGQEDVCLELALHHLSAAVDAGYSHVDHMAKDPDLEVLRIQRPFPFITILRRAKHSLRQVSRREPP
mmetsp:Transcript_13906/g.25625  ORF Transcript_13906/g.25625 Transcript_13906/m.25625 type:complete len:538 (-) Transcript_13906:124-1737(-)